MRAGALLLLAACAHLKASPAAPSDEERIRARLSKWVEQFNSGDYLGAATIWAPDLIGVIPGHPDDTWDREQLGARNARPGPIKFELKIDEILVDGDLAVVRDTWRQLGGPKVEVFRSFEVWRRQAGGEWKISRWIDAAPEP